MSKNKKLIVFLGDLIVVFLSFILSLRIGYWSNFTPEVYRTHLGPFLIIYIVWLFMLFAFGMYEVENLRPNIKSTKNLLFGLGIALLISTTFFYIFNIFGISPKTNLFINIFFFTMFFLLERKIITLIFNKKYIEKILLIGEGGDENEFVEKIKEYKNLYYKIESHISILDSKIIKNIEDGKFDIIIFSKKETGLDPLKSKIEKLIHVGIKFMDITKAYEKILEKIPSNQIDDVWLITEIGTVKNKIYDLVKRFLEVIFSLSLFIILSPILLIIFILIKIEDGGPFIYSQVRTGKMGKNFLIYKIRSMIRDSEKNGAEWAKDKDPRITKIGKFLRNSHLDESMQLINIIKGDISIVGPRPERPEFVKNLIVDIKNYNLRHIIKPGITGWAQINYKYGNTTEDSKQKFEYDLYYIKNRNMIMDIEIIARTIKTIFF